MTASVGFVAPATFVICRSLPTLPTDTAPAVELTATPEIASVWPFMPARFATEPAPRATPPFCCTTALKPMAVPDALEADAPVPMAMALVAVAWAP